MNAARLKLPTFVCLRCGHRWHPSKEHRPRCCGFCKSPYWDAPPGDNQTSRARVRHDRECRSCA